MADNQWKLTFYPKPLKEETKPAAGTGETGGGTPVEEEEEEKKGEEIVETPTDLTESVKVQVQLLKVPGAEDQYVVEFKNKDFGSSRLFYETMDFMKGKANTGACLSKYESKQPGLAE